LLKETKEDASINFDLFKALLKAPFTPTFDFIEILQVQDFLLGQKHFSRILLVSSLFLFFRHVSMNCTQLLEVTARKNPPQSFE